MIDDAVVGPCIASGSQVCSGNCALLPQAPANTPSAPIPSIQLSGNHALSTRLLAAAICAGSAASDANDSTSPLPPSCSDSTSNAPMPIRKPASPTRFMTNALHCA